jgi:hypothetical protein
MSDPTILTTTPLPTAFGAEAALKVLANAVHTYERDDRYRDETAATILRAAMTLLAALRS